MNYIPSGKEHKLCILKLKIILAIQIVYSYHKLDLVNQKNS